MTSPTPSRRAGGVPRHTAAERGGLSVRSARRTSSNWSVSYKYILCYFIISVFYRLFLFSAFVSYSDSISYSACLLFRTLILLLLFIQHNSLIQTNFFSIIFLYLLFFKRFYIKKVLIDTYGLIRFGNFSQINKNSFSLLFFSLCFLFSLCLLFGLFLVQTLVYDSADLKNKPTHPDGSDGWIKYIWLIFYTITVTTLVTY